MSDGPLQKLDIASLLQEEEDKKKRRWYEEDDFLEGLLSDMERQCTPKDASVFSDKNTKRQEDVLRKYNANKMEFLRHETRISGKSFWNRFPGRYATLLGKTKVELQQIVPCLVKQLKVFKRRRDRKHLKIRHGINTKGKLLHSKDARYPSESNDLKEQRDFFQFIPELVVSEKVSESTMKSMEEVEKKLATMLAHRKKKRSKGWWDCPRRAAEGLSLAKTTVTGGYYADKSNGIAGSFHDNPHLFALKDLEDEMVEVISDFIVEAFGQCIWYKCALSKLEDLPDCKFIKQRRIPCSHIWWTRSLEVNNVHVDNNTVGPAFLFTSISYGGGNLSSYTPKNGVRNITMERGVVVGGRWAQFPHSSTPAQIGRTSFVVYLDYRVLRDSYQWIPRSVQTKKQRRSGGKGKLVPKKPPNKASKEAAMWGDNVDCYFFYDEINQVAEV